jgi:cyclophilin family peptidyl-prolyl cis-trans isomerase
MTFPRDISEGGREPRRAKPAVAAAVCSSVFVLAGCGGSNQQKGATTCPTSGKQVSFPLLDRSKTSTVGVLTNFGRFDIRLDVKDSPCTTSSFAALVRKRFFDGTRFHRIVPGFVIQGGDPTGTGQGGPGYTVQDVPPADATYTKGVVAMAKTGAEPSGTSGSQFFVVTAADAGLPPQYALLGTVTKGLRVVDWIGKLGNPATERPTRKVVIQKMIVTP